jgi:acetyltransferase-like isoleucine patch superfamily enzyme
MTSTVIRRLHERIQRLIQTKFWGMDIHPSARIAPSALIDRTWPRGIHIGADCFIDEQAVVLTHDFTRGVYLHTRLGARCRLGPRAIVLPGLTLGDDCVVMPGALVTKDMPANSLAIGNPAEIRTRDPVMERPTAGSDAP